MTRIVGVDVGGTFTDMFLFDDAAGSFQTTKVPSNRGDEAVGFTQGLRSFGALKELGSVVHGTTVATNALLEGKGAAVAMLVTEGHRDVLEMREGLKPERYNLRMAPPAPLVPRALRLPVQERMRADGTVETPLDPASLGAALDALAASGAQAVAVCFLHAWRNPAHERADHGLGSVSLAPLGVRGMGVALVDQGMHCCDSSR